MPLFRYSTLLAFFRFSNWQILYPAWFLVPQWLRFQAIWGDTKEVMWTFADLCPCRTLFRLRCEWSDHRWASLRTRVSSAETPFRHVWDVIVQRWWRPHVATFFQQRKCVLATIQMRPSETTSPNNKGLHALVDCNVNYVFEKNSLSRSGKQLFQLIEPITVISPESLKIPPIMTVVRSSCINTSKHLWEIMNHPCFFRN